MEGNPSSENNQNGGAWPLNHLIRVFLAALILCVLVNGAAAHPVSITRSFVYVSRDQITARIEVLVEDLVLFHGLELDERDFLKPEVVRQGIEKHKEFLLERFRIRDLAGRSLDGRVAGVDEPEMSPEGIALAELMAHQLVFEIRYTLSSAPEFLTFSQHFAGEEAAIPVEMSLVVKQENSAALHTTALRAGRPETVRFSWTNPPLSPEASREDEAAWLTRQKEETLGIISYSSVYSFLYIDDREVRHEILIPLLTLERSLPIARDGDEFLDVSEQDAARGGIEAYFTSGNPIEIDGVEVQPVVERCDFYGLDLKDFARRAERRPVSIASARVGIILVYDTVRDDTAQDGTASYGAGGSPRSVKVTWNRFSDSVWSIDMIVYAYDQISKTTLSRIGDRNTYEWRNPGRPPRPPIRQVGVAVPPRPTWSVPVISLACLTSLLLIVWRRKLRGAALRSSLPCAVLLVAGALTWPFFRWDVPVPLAPSHHVSDDEADAIFESLLKNVFRAFDCRGEDAIYDALARSVDGGLLADLYLQVRRGLEMREQGGAVSRVREVRVVSGRREALRPSRRPGPGGFDYRCQWTVSGTVEHWGHVHERTSRYEALFTVEPRDEAWRITGMEILDEQRVRSETKVRGL